MLGVDAAGKRPSGRCRDTLERRDDAVGSGESALGDQVGHQRFDGRVLDTGHGTPDEDTRRDEGPGVGEGQRRDGDDESRERVQEGTPQRS